MGGRVPIKTDLGREEDLELIGSSLEEVVWWEEVFIGELGDLLLPDVKLDHQCAHSLLFRLERHLHALISECQLLVNGINLSANGSPFITFHIINLDLQVLGLPMDPSLDGHNSLHLLAHGVHSLHDSLRIHRVFALHGLNTRLRGKVPLLLLLLGSGMRDLQFHGFVDDLLEVLVLLLHDRDLLIEFDHDALGEKEAAEIVKSPGKILVEDIQSLADILPD